MRVEAWPEADRLFRSDPRWCGGDAASSVTLGGDRVLWLFGDTFRGERSPGSLVRSSVGIQDGLDPTTADIRFFFDVFSHPAPGTWVWVGQGTLLGAELLVFFMHVRQGPHQFEVFGWDAAVVTNPDDDPSGWTIRWLHPDPNPHGAVIGAAGVFTADGYLYAYGPSAPDTANFVYGKSRDLWLRAFLVRWPLDTLPDRIGDPQWWGKDGWGSADDATPVFDDAHMEFSVHPDGDGFVQVQGRGIIGGGLGIRRAEGPEGPWGPLEVVHRPPESHREDLCVYAYKAQPHLDSDGLAVTYASNGRTVQTTLDDPNVYYPRFLRLRP